MAVKATQLHDPDFLFKLGPEYVCTGFMFDENIKKTDSVESQLSKEGFMPGIDIAHAEEIAAKKGEAKYIMEK